MENQMKDDTMALSNIPITRREEQLILAFRAIERFNNIIGNKASYESLLNQCERVQEELDETFDSLTEPRLDPETHSFILKQNIDKLGLLDGIDDVLVTSLGLIAKAEALGYDVLGSLEEVCYNNNEKFVNEEKQAAETVLMYAEQNVGVVARYNTEYNVYAIVRKEDGKLMKCKGYKPVEISKYVSKL